MAKIASHIIVLFLGLILGYWLFNTPPPVADKRIAQLAPPPVESQNRDALPPPPVETSELADPILVSKLKTIITTQKEKIEELEFALQQIDAIKASQEIVDPPVLETISMKEMESRFKDSIKNRFKKYAIELDKEQLAEFQKMFESDQTKETWSAEYENYISRFISEEDRDGLHYVDEINCNQRMCRLQVQTSDEDHWQQLYSNMTQQDWFNSMTLTEKSDIPGMFIYYIPKPQTVN